MKQWVIPKGQSAEFVCRMEAVLSVYERRYEEQHPVICLDESPRQLIEVGQERKADGSLVQDSEYVRRGVAEMYMAFEPLAGKRYVRIEDNHTAKTWVKVVAALLDNEYKDCPTITLVEDNLTAHRPCTFYEVYEPATAKAYLDRIEFVFTPKHGSWLNMAEIELSVLERDCKGSFETKEKLLEHLHHWQQQRNEKQVKANWQFTDKEARIRLKKLYPTI
ncbi:MAG: IS630 family transposase [Flavisolibacter sp.]|nr:IS630 family transposase [Flavisolibacter sp.]